MDNQDALSKVIINGQEYDPTEAQEFIETGRKTRELEQKYNTKLDNVWPEYTRTSQEASQLRKDLAEAKAEIERYSSKKEQSITTSRSEDADAIEAARKLGLVLNEDLGNQGFIKKEDLDKYFEEKETNSQRKAQVLAEADRYEKEIDGSDGRPNFNKKAVLAYAAQYGFGDLQQAYEDMNESSIKAWKDAQITAQKAKSLQTLGNGGDKSPKTPKVNKDNFRDILRETLE